MLLSSCYRWIGYASWFVPGGDRSSLSLWEAPNLLNLIQAAFQFGVRRSVLLITAYSETRVNVSRSHCTQVDATNKERRPFTTVNRPHQLWFHSDRGALKTGCARFISCRRNKSKRLTPTSRAQPRRHIRAALWLCSRHCGGLRAECRRTPER